MPLLLAVLLLGPAAACGVCEGTRTFGSGVRRVALPAGDLSGCFCAFTWEFGGGPVQGLLRIDRMGSHGNITVYDRLEAGAVPLAEFAAADMPSPFRATVRPAQGEVTLVFTTPADAPVVTEPPLQLDFEPVNDAPVIERHPVDFYCHFDPFSPGAVYPVSAGNDPNTFDPRLPVLVRDYYNEAGLLVELEIDDEFDPQPMWITGSDWPNVAFVTGRPGVPTKRLVIRGPPEGIANSLDTTRLSMDYMSSFSITTLRITARDMAAPDELVAVFEISLGGYAHGHAILPRGVAPASGFYTPSTGSEGTFVVTRAARLWLTSMTNYAPTGIPGNPCFDGTFVRVFDGIDATGVLLSTSQFPTGEICQLLSASVPPFTSVTGTFFVEFSATTVNSFITEVLPTPAEFAVWTEHNQTLTLAAGEASGLGEIFITSLPDPASLEVRVQVSAGAVELTNPQSFGDVASTSDGGGVLVLAQSASDRHVMYRITEALVDLIYVASAAAGDGTITLTATSGGGVAELVIPVVVVESLTIVAPPSLSLHALRIADLSVRMVGSGIVTVTIAAELGTVSLDPRARHWVDVGFTRNQTVGPASVAEVNERLAQLVYRADHDGRDNVLVVAGEGIAHTTLIDVHPDCDGAYTMYAREGTFTERVGPPPDVRSGALDCSWTIIGGRALSFPYWEVAWGTAFLTVSSSTTILWNQPLPFRDPPSVIRTPDFFVIDFISIFVPGVVPDPGFVGHFTVPDGQDDPPLIVLTGGALVVQQGSTIRLSGLYVLAEGAVFASALADDGWIGQVGTRLSEVTCDTFEELDAWVTGLVFVPEIGRSGTITVTVTELETGATALHEMVVTVLSCIGDDVVRLDAQVDAGAAVTIEDGSGLAQYTPSLRCGWQAVGLPAPAVLDADLLDLDCQGDTVVVYDGSSADGRRLGSFCDRNDVDAAGTLLSTSGAFFVALETDETVEDDGFAFVYRGVRAGERVTLESTPESGGARVGGATVALDDGRVAVVFGSNRIRSLATILIYDDGHWAVLAGDGPEARTRAAATATTATATLVVHGGEGEQGQVLGDTWIGEIGESTVEWRAVATNGPATSSASLMAVGERVVLVATTGMWTLESDAWSAAGLVPDGAVPTSLSDGFMVAGSDGAAAIWRLESEADLLWEHVADVAGPVGCRAWGCFGAVIGAGEYALVDAEGNGARVQVQTGAAAPLAIGAVSGMAPATAGFFGHPAAYVYGGSAMHVVAAMPGVSQAVPRVAPVAGGTVVTVHGSRFEVCGRPECVIGDGAATAAALDATVLNDWLCLCTMPAVDAAGARQLRIACSDGVAHATDAPILYHAPVEIRAVEPAKPQPGDLLLVDLGAVSADVLAAVEAPACLFGPDVVEGTVVGGTQLQCRVPADAEAGVSLVLRVSLDGQQFSAAEVQVAVRSREGTDLFDKSTAAIAGLVMAGVLLVLSALLYARSPKRPQRSVILATAIGLVDFYFDVVFAVKLADENSSLFVWSLASLIATLSLNFLLVVMFTVRKTRVSPLRQDFLAWLEDRGVLALSVASMLALVRVSSLGLLMTRLGGLARFDADGLTTKDWHRLAMQDVGSAILEDMAQFVIQIAYLSGESAKVDIVTVVTVVLSVLALVLTLFKGMVRSLLLAAGGGAPQQTQVRALQAEEMVR